ncbi:MAG: TspO/MBR family protein [Raoultibacter sp.]
MQDKPSYTPQGNDSRAQTTPPQSGDHPQGAPHHRHADAPHSAHTPRRADAPRSAGATRHAATTRFAPQRATSPSAPRAQLPSFLTPEILVVWVAFVAMVVCNALFEILKLGGVTSADVSNEVFAWFAPAGYVFSIWSLIYIGLVVWLVLFTRNDRAREPFFGLPFSIEGVLFVLSCVLNVAWLLSWHLRVFPASITIIICLLVCVALLYVLTRRQADAWYQWAPVSLYMAWLCVATLANIAHVATRQSMGDIFLVSAISTVVLVLVVWVLAFVMKRLFGDFVFGLVVLWAAIGIGVRLIDVSAVVGVIVIAFSAIAAFLLYFPWQRFAPKQSPRRKKAR